MKRSLLFALLLAVCAATPHLNAQNAAGNPDTAKLIEAAERGDAEAQNKLGEYYAKGSAGLKRDIREAMNWYNKAAKQGNFGAITGLRNLAIQGNAEAKRWLGRNGL